MHGMIKPDGFYGAKELFFPETLDQFAERIVSPKPTKLIPDKPHKKRPQRSSAAALIILGDLQLAR
jgi:hypothetical protein